MGEFFLKVVNMSISASWIVLAVLLLRVLLKKAPKWITVLLWGVVAIRLICPFSIESIMSLIPSTETISPEIMMETTPSINTGIPIINNAVNPVIEESLSPSVGDSANPLQIIIPVLAIAWIAGIAVMLGYTVISYFRVKMKIGTAVLLRDNIFQSESVVSPFVLGIIKPKIYIPFNMNEQDMEHVIAHENAHIRRKDYLWKPLGFLILTLHWFNPLMWLGYVLLCRDIELACDEKVIKELNIEQKADYSQALLACSVNRRMIAVCPLAFGEVGVKNRVKSVLNYKKPAFWIVIVAIIASVAVAVCFLTNPRKTTLSNTKIPEASNLFDNVSEFQIYIPEIGYDEFHWDNMDYLVDCLRDIEISEEKISDNRSFDRAKYYNVWLRYGDSYKIIHFDKDCKTFWIDDNKEASFSYSVIDSQAVKKFFKKISIPEISYLPEYSFKASNTSFKNLKIVVSMDVEKGSAVNLTVFDQQTYKKIQSIKLNENDIFTRVPLYIIDVNFDGEKDLIIPYQRPAAAQYFTAYVWDAKTKQYVYAPSFENLPNVALDADKKVILSRRSSDKITSYAISVFNPVTKDFEVQKSLYYHPDGDNKMVYKEENYENGKEQTVRSFTKPREIDNYYLMDSETYSYYSNHTEWDLDSSRWENYLIKPEESGINAVDGDNQSHYEQSSDGNITVSDKQIENRLLYNQISNKTYKICFEYSEELYKKAEMPTKRQAVIEQLEFDIVVCNLAKKKGVLIDRDQTDSFAKSEFEIMKTDSSQETYKEALFKVLEQENISYDKYMELGCEKAYYLYNTVALKQEFQKTYYDSSSKMNLDEQFEKYVLKNK